LPKVASKRKEKKKSASIPKAREGKKSSKGKKLLEAKKTPRSSEWEFSHAVAFWGLAILLFLPPYFRGLFFQPEQERALIFAAVIFWIAWLWKWSKRDYSFLSGPLDYFALALPVVYIISAFTAVNKGLAVDEVVKNVLYFLTYWSASRLVRDEEDIHKLLHVIYISAIGVALAGLATATGIIHINDGFLGGRIYSTFQYPNALASYLGAVSFIGMYLWYRSREFTAGAKIAGQAFLTSSLPAWLTNSNPWGCLYSCGNFLLLAVLLGTKSRGGLLVLGLVFLVYLAGLGARGRLAVTLHVALTAAAAYAGISKFIPLAMNKSYNEAWIWILAGLAVVLVIQAVYRVIDRAVFAAWAGSPGKFNLAFAALAGLCTAAGIALLRGRADLWDKITSFSFLRSAVSRMDFVNDAVEMIKAKPLLGWGGGGWEEAYRSFQDYLYTSNEAHSHYFQVGVETGIPGILVILGIWASFLYIAHRLYHGSKGDDATRSLVWVIAAAAVSVGLHAAIDFDLSLSALTLVTWTMFGIASGMAARAGKAGQPVPRKKRAGTRPPNYTPLVLASLASILVMAPALLLAQSHSYVRQAGQYLQAQQIDKGLAYLEKAAACNPYKADFRVPLSQIYRVRSEHEKSLAQALRAVELSPYNAQLRFNLADTYIAAGRFAPAVEQAEKAVELSPFQQHLYEMLSERYFIIGYKAIEQGDRQEARECLLKAGQLPDKLKAVMDDLPEHYKKMWIGQKLYPSHAVLFNAGAAKYQLGDYSQAEKYLQAAAKSADKNIKGNALLWLALAADKQGQPARAGELLKQAGELVPDAELKYNRISKMPVLK